MKIVKIKEGKICTFQENVKIEMMLKVNKKQSFTLSSDSICFEIYSQG